MGVFRHYDQAGLELQYDTNARTPEISAIRDARAARTDAESAAVRKTARARLDVAYGAHDREKFDVFQADQPGGPLVAFIHGGYWKQRSKAEFAWMAPAFTSRGINLANIGYPLCPEVRIGDIVASCRTALLQLAVDGKGLGFDPGRIHVAGHSAGGHLAAMMQLTDFAALGGPADLVRSATCVSGLYDLEPLTMVKANAELNIRKEDIAPLSPLLLTPRRKVPVTLTVGDLEAEEFVRNTVELSDAWNSRGATTRMVEARGRYHFDILDDLTTPGKPLYERTMSVVLG